METKQQRESLLDGKMEEEEPKAKPLEVSLVEEIAITVPKECDSHGSEVTEQQLKRYERHRVVKCVNCSFLLELDAATFNHGLKIFFLFTLTICLFSWFLSIILLEEHLSWRYIYTEKLPGNFQNQPWQFGFFSYRLSNIVLLAVLAAVVAFCWARKAWIKSRQMPHRGVSERPRGHGFRCQNYCELLHT